MHFKSSLHDYLSILIISTLHQYLQTIKAMNENNNHYRKHNIQTMEYNGIIFVEIENPCSVLV